MKKLLHVSLVIACFIYANVSAQPAWKPGCFLHENFENGYKYKPVRMNTEYGQYYGLGNTFIDVNTNNISINSPEGCGFINQGMGNIGSQSLDYDIWPNHDVDDICVFRLFDQNAGAGHPFPYVNIQYGGNYDIIPPAGINYISGSVHAYASGINYGFPSFPSLGWLLHNTGDGKGAAVYSYLKNPSGVKKFRLKGYRTYDWIYVPNPSPWEVYDVDLSIPATAQILDVVGVESYIYVIYYTNTSTLKALVYDYDGNLINATPFTHSLGTGNTFNMASIQFYIDVSTLNIIGDCFKNGNNKIFADQLTPGGFTHRITLPLAGNQQGVFYNLKSELQDNSIYIDAKNVTTNKRVLYKIDRYSYAVYYSQTMNYTGDYFIDKSTTGGITNFYIFNMDLTGTILNVDRYAETASGFPTLTASSAVNCFLPAYDLNDFFQCCSAAPYQLVNVIDQGYTCSVVLESVTPPLYYFGPFAMTVDLTGFPLRTENGFVGNQNNTATISTYPNPASDEVTVSFTSDKEIKGTLRLCDLTGKVLLEEQLQLVTGANHQTISTADFEPGIYFISIATEEGVVTSKLIRE